MKYQVREFQFIVFNDWLPPEGKELLKTTTANAINEHDGNQQEQQRPLEENSLRTQKDKLKWAKEVHLLYQTKKTTRCSNIENVEKAITNQQQKNWSKQHERIVFHFFGKYHRQLKEASMNNVLCSFPNDFFLSKLKTELGLPGIIPRFCWRFV